MEKYNCPTCKKEFYKKVYKKVQAVYCCQKCAYKGRTLGFTKRIIVTPYNVDRTPAEWKLKNCEVCEKKYTAKKKTQKYCCRKCFEVNHKLNMLGDKNPAYINGNSFKKRSYRGEDWETLRLEIYKRDNFKCQKCGVKCESKRDYKNSDNIIQCHHIENYNINKNNNNNNLITLCLKCHLKEHNGKI